jgi:hypothetical protein
MRAAESLEERLESVAEVTGEKIRPARACDAGL